MFSESPTSEGSSFERFYFQDLISASVGELLNVIAVAHAVVAQDVAVVPEFPDDGGAIHLRRFSFSPSSMAASMARARSGS